MFNEAKNKLDYYTDLIYSKYSFSELFLSSSNDFNKNVL